MMGRNLDRRVELMFPINDLALAETIRCQILDLALSDNQQSRELEGDGSYGRITPGPGEELVNSQAHLIQSRLLAVSAKKPVPRETAPTKGAESKAQGL